MYSGVWESKKENKGFCELKYHAKDMSALDKINIIHFSEGKKSHKISSGEEIKNLSFTGCLVSLPLL